MYSGAQKAKEKLSSFGYKVGYANVKTARRKVDCEISPTDENRDVLNLNCWSNQNLDTSWEPYEMAKAADSMFAVGGEFTNHNKGIG